MKKETKNWLLFISHEFASLGLSMSYHIKGLLKDLENGDYEKAKVRAKVLKSGSLKRMDKLVLEIVQKSDENPPLDST